MILPNRKLRSNNSGYQNPWLFVVPLSPHLLPSSLDRPTLISLQVFLFPVLVTAGFNLFSCTSRSVSGVRYLTPDLSLACDTPTHEFMKVLGAVVIGLAGFGIPALLAFTLYRRRTQLFSSATFAALGALYDGYAVERGRYAFESIVMLRKMGAVMIGNLVTDAFGQLTAALLLLLALTLCQMLLQPFAVSIWAALDALSMISLLATLSLSLMYLRWATPASQCAGLADTDVQPGSVLSCGQVRAQADSSEVAVTAVLIVMHAAVLAVFAASYIRLVYLRKLRARLRTALAKAAIDEADTAAHAGALKRLGASGASGLHAITAAAAAGEARCIEAAVTALLRAEAGARGSRRPSAARRASTAAMEFVRRAVKPKSQSEAAAAIAAAELLVDPATVTQAQRQLGAAHQAQRSGRLSSSGASSCRCDRFTSCLARTARRLCRPWELLDSGLIAACEVSEGTTARVFGLKQPQASTTTHAATRVMSTGGANITASASGVVEPSTGLGAASLATATLPQQSSPAPAISSGNERAAAAGSGGGGSFPARFAAPMAAVAARTPSSTGRGVTPMPMPMRTASAGTSAVSRSDSLDAGSGSKPRPAAVVLRLKSAATAMALASFRSSALPGLGGATGSSAGSGTGASAISGAAFGSSSAAVQLTLRNHSARPAPGQLPPRQGKVTSAAAASADMLQPLAEGATEESSASAPDAVGEAAVDRASGSAYQDAARHASLHDAEAMAETDSLSSDSSNADSAFLPADVHFHD